MSSGATLFDQVAQRPLVYTNRFNLLEILSRRLIPPRSGFDDERYFSDLAELCLGRIPVVACPASADVLKHVSSGGGGAFPVALELDVERLAPAEVAALMIDGGAGEAVIGAPGAAAWAPEGAIPLSTVTTVHFRSAAELDEHRVRRYENVRDDLPLVVSPELFESRAPAEIVPWLRTLDPMGDTDLRGPDRTSGALILVAEALPADEEATAVFASTLNGRGGSKRTRPRGVAPWLFALVAGPRRGADVNERIFAAGVDVLAELDYPRTWRPVDHAQAVREAVAGSRLKASDRDDLNRHFDAIAGVLKNERDFRPFRPDAGLAAAKALLLVLMRPDPDEQLAWPADETGADDAVRLTAAAFLGVLHGRKRLAVAHRPPELDDFLAEQEAAAVESSVAPSVGAVRVSKKQGVLTVTAVRTKRRLLTRELPPTKVVAGAGQQPDGDDMTGSALEAVTGSPMPQQAVDPAFVTALAFAAAAHATQPRKGTTFPYVVHPIRVAEILYRHGCDPDVVVAGLLHDVLEDTGTEVEELEERFNARVAKLAQAVSEPSKLLGEERPRVERMDEAIAHVRAEADPDVLRIIAADKLDNVRSIRDTIAERGATATWALFSAPAEEQSRYYRRVAEALTERFPREPLFQLLTLEVQAVFPHPGDATSARFFYAQPLVAPEQARPYLADAKVQWKKGRSAYELAHSWIGAGDIPTTVRAVLEKEETFAGCELVEGLFERQVGLRTPGRPSQTDLLLLLRLPVGHAVVAVEGKAGESFDKTVDTWNDSDGKTQRLRSLCDTLGIAPEAASPLRYQLLHRTVSAVYEAERYGVSQAVMLVHAFAEDETGLADFDRFVRALGLATPQTNTLSSPRKLENVELRLGWIQDRAG